MLLTVATPTWVFTFTTLPPAASIAFWASAADVPSLYNTTYSVWVADPAAAGAACAGTARVAATIAAVAATTVKRFTSTSVWTFKGGDHI
ncbi:hypothetical protein Mame01_46980 [Microbispora amethystogenes]|nr:hypothetical protein Mame01_46980 [Microbispora amethystogenes]